MEVPEKLRFNLNGISLAHLLMGDGNYLKGRNMIRIFTNNFEKQDVILLSNIISENLNIENRVIHDRNDQYIILMQKENVLLTRKIILPALYTSKYVL